jgi:hypothetical protein
MLVFAASIVPLIACTPLEDAFLETHGLESNATGRFMGELPVIDGFDQDEVSVAQVYSSSWNPGTLEINLHAFEWGGWGMAAVDVREASLVEGEPVAASIYDGLGCSGPDRDTLVFDELPRSVTVQLDTLLVDGVRTPHYTVDAEFSEGWVHGQVVPMPGALDD